METKNITILDKLVEHAKYKSHQEAFVFVSQNGDRLPITWKELYINVCRTATGFVKMGVKQNEYVYYMTRNCPEALYAIFGAMMAGAIPCSGHETDVKNAVAKLGFCSMMIIDPAKNDDIWASMKNVIGMFTNDGTVSNSDLPYLRYILCIEDGRNKETINLRSVQQLIQMNLHIDHFPVPKGEVCIVVRSSGSTGFPKFVKKSAIGGRYEPLYHTLKSKTSRLYYDNSFMFPSGFPTITVSKGITRVMLLGFCDPENYIKIRSSIIIQERCRSFGCLCYEVDELVDHQNEITDLENWPLRDLWTGGQPMTSKAYKVVGRLAKMIGISYSSTEAGSISSYTVTDPDKFENYCAGYLLPKVQVKIVDDIEQELPNNSKGEILVKKPNMFIEYVDNKEATKKAYTSDGWYRTGDIGLMTPEKKLFVFGRKGYRITLSDITEVEPYDIEAKLMVLDGVEAAIIVPVTPENGYPKLCACIVQEAQKCVSEATLRAEYKNLLIRRKDCQDITPFEIEYYLFYKRFPMTISCKYDRKELAKMANEEIQSVHKY